MLSRRDIVDLSHRRKATAEQLEKCDLYQVDWSIQYKFQRTSSSPDELRLNFPVFGTRMEMHCLSHPNAEIKDGELGYKELVLDVSEIPVDQPFKLELLQKHYNGFQGMKKEHISFDFPFLCDDFVCKIYWPHDMDPYEDRFTFFKYPRNDERDEAYNEYKTHYNDRRRDFEWHLKKAQREYRYEVQWEWRRYNHLTKDYPYSFFESKYQSTR